MGVAHLGWSYPTSRRVEPALTRWSPSALRLRRLELETDDFAIVSDGAHEYSLVHYFTAHDAQFRQFGQEGLEPLLAADLAGRALDRDYRAPDCPEIHYVARRAAPA